jgi:plastocyanin
MRVPRPNIQGFAPAALALALGLAVAVLVAGCGSSSNAATSSSTATATETGNTAHIIMKSLAFNPSLIHATVGQKVLWSNVDNAPHNVTYVSGPRFPSSKTLNPGHHYEITLTEPGTINYYCTIHPFMKATIVVTP